MRTREAGVTLIDTVIGVALVVVILAVAYPGLRIANDTMATGGARDRLERAGDKMLKTLSHELRAGLVSAFQDSPPSITVYRPDRGVSLSDMTGEGKTPWAANPRILRFRQMTTITETAEREDINGDGDRNDTYALGVLEIEENGEARPILERSRVILGMPNHVGDVDGDGEADPLFLKAGRSVRVVVHLITRDNNNRILRTAVRTTLHLRNLQEK